MSLLYLVFLLLILPWAAWRTARRLNSTEPLLTVTRIRYWRSAVLIQSILLAFAWVAGAGFGFRLFQLEGLGWMEAFAGVAALVACFLVRGVFRRLHSEPERRKLAVYKRAPRTRAELTWFCAAVIVASVAEEVAYRGVGWAILSYSLGSPWLAAAILCGAFSLAHCNQGWKSGMALGMFAAVLHALVAVTGTLVIAMGVHAVYNFAVGYQIRRVAAEFDQENIAGK